MKQLAACAALLPLACCATPTGGISISVSAGAMPLTVSLPAVVVSPVPAIEAPFAPLLVEVPPPTHYQRVTKKAAIPRPAAFKTQQATPVAPATLGPSIDY